MPSNYAKQWRMKNPIFQFIVIPVIISFLFYSCGRSKKTLFTLLTPDHTSIGFSNRIFENDSVNIIDNEYVYNGGGVAIGDFNNDGLQDVYFTGNMVSNKLYLNKGNMKVSDVTGASRATGEGRWPSLRPIARPRSTRRARRYPPCGDTSGRSQRRTGRSPSGS